MTENSGSPQQLPPGFAGVSLPASLRRHRLTQHDRLYALPSVLLEALHDEAKHSLLDSTALSVEQQFASHCDAHRIVGYRRRASTLKPSVILGVLADTRQQQSNKRAHLAAHSTVD